MPQRNTIKCRLLFQIINELLCHDATWYRTYDLLFLLH